MARKLVFSLLTAIALPLAMIACSYSSNAPSASTTSTESTPASTGPTAATTAATPTGPQIVEVKTGDMDGGYSQDPAQITVQPGVINIKLVNNSAERPHNLVLKGKTGDDLGKTADRVQPAQSDSFTVTVTEEGTYELLCTITGHADRGAKSTFTVRKPAQ